MIEYLNIAYEWWISPAADPIRNVATIVIPLLLFYPCVRLGRWVYYRIRHLIRKPRGKIFPQERKMDQGAIENRIAADLITDTFEDALHQGVLSEKAVHRLYKRIAKYGGLRDLVPIARSKRKKLHPWAVELLKERIKLRITAMITEPVHNIPDLGNVVPLKVGKKHGKVRATR